MWKIFFSKNYIELQDIEQTEVSPRVYIVGEQDPFKKLRSVLSPEEWFWAQITIKCSVHNETYIKVLQTTGTIAFTESCFGKFGDIDEAWVKQKCLYFGQLLHYILTKRAVTSKRQKLWFIIDSKPTRFSIREFSLVTGFKMWESTYLVKKRSRTNPNLWHLFLGYKSNFFFKKRLATVVVELDTWKTSWRPREDFPFIFFGVESLEHG